MQVTTETDVYALDIVLDPYVYYGELRENDPVHWHEANEMWLLTRHEDVAWYVRQPKIFSSENWRKDRDCPNPPVDKSDRDSLVAVTEFRSQEFIQNDPPEHSRMRVPLNGNFTTRAME